MKKIILSLFIILATTALADNFVVVVDKDENAYNSGSVVVSDWLKINKICSYDNIAEDFYYGVDFKQIETCSIEEERTITTTRYNNGVEEVIKETEERTRSEVSEPLDLVGTHLESSCQNILMNGFGSKDGYFKIKRGDKEPNVYCDMEEGGWTLYLIANNSQNDWKNIDWDTGWTPVPSLNINNYSDLENICLTATGLPTYADYQTTTSSTSYWNVAREFLYNETSWFNVPNTAGDGGGIALGLKWTGSNWVTLAGQSAGVIQPSGTDTGDLCDGNLQVCGFWDARDNLPPYGYGAGAEDWGFDQTAGVMCGGLLDSDTYKVIEEYTTWTNEGEKINCSNDLESENVHFETNFAQTTTCDQNQKRTKTIYNENELTGERTLVSSSEETQTIQVQSISSLIGTYKSISCRDALNHNANTVNGINKIFLNGVQETVFCDMSTGGWTLLLSTGTDEGQQSMTGLSINKNNPPTNVNYSHYDYYPKMDDFLSTFNANTEIRFRCKDKVNGNTRAYYHKNISNFNTYFNLATGSYTGSVTCATNQSFTENVGNDAYTCIGGNNTMHRYYRASINEYGWAHYDSTSYPQMLRHCGSTFTGDGVNNHSQGYIWYR